MQRHFNFHLNDEKQKLKATWLVNSRGRNSDLGLSGSRFINSFYSARLVNYQNSLQLILPTLFFPINLFVSSQPNTQLATANISLFKQGHPRYTCLSSYASVCYLEIFVPNLPFCHTYLIPNNALPLYSRILLVKQTHIL